MENPAILFLEDDYEVRDDVVGLLDSNGYEVLMVANEEEALDLLAAQDRRVELILLEQKMPSDKTLEIGRRIRKHPRVNKEAPVVVLPYEFDSELEGVNERIADRDYKLFLTDPKQLHELMAELLTKNA